MLALDAGAEEEQQVDEVPSGTEQLVAIAPVDEPPLPPPYESPADAGKAPGPPRRKKGVRSQRQKLRPPLLAFAGS